MANIEMCGLPQIDYVIRSERITQLEEKEMISAFQRHRLWKEKEWDKIKEV